MEKVEVFQDFNSLSLSHREKALSNSLVISLLNSFSNEIRESFISCFLHPSLEKKEKLRDFFSDTGNSFVTSYIINHKTSSHKALEMLYNKDTNSRYADKCFYRFPGGDAINDRLINGVVANLPKIINKIKSPGRNILIPGSGPAQDIIKILELNHDIYENTKVICVDNEISAVELGRRLAKEAGVIDKINFIYGDFMKMNNFVNSFDLILLVGIICPMSNREARILLKKVSRYGKKDSFIVFSSAIENMLYGDPVTSFIMDIIGWKLNYRKIDDMKKLAEDSFLSWKYHFHDPKYKYHCVAVTTKK